MLAALDRRAPAREGPVVADAARLARADAQIRAIIGDRIRGRLEEPALAARTAALRLDVAEHRLDPYAAVDVLLGVLDAQRR